MRHAVALACALAALASIPASAQDAGDSVKYSLPPVTITGTRTPQSWLDVPSSLSFIGAKELGMSRGYGIDEVLGYVPGVLAQSRSGNQDVRLIIRGFGARGAGERSNAGTTRGIRVLNNGFPETEPDGRTSLDLVDFATAGGMEVVRSNASSLYGNAGGGVLSVSSNTSFGRPYAAFRQSFGSFGFHREQVTAGAFLGTGRLYFAMGNSTSRGWREHSRGSHAIFSAGIVTSPGENTDLGVHVTAASNVFRIPGALTKEQYDADPAMSDSIYVARDERRNNRLGRIGVSAEHRIDDRNAVMATAFVQPKFLERSERGTYRTFTRYHVGGSGMYRNSSEIGREASNTFLAGVDEAYQDGAILFYTLSPEGGRALPLRDDKREGANNFGAFVQDELSLGTAWKVLAGVRYDAVDYTSENYVDLSLHQRKKFERFTPKAGITYHFSPTHTVYASLGGGLEVPAGNETDPAGTYGQDTVYAINPLLDAMKSTTIEAGTKQILVLGAAEDPAATLTYDVSAYWLRVTDDIIPYRNGRFYFTAGRTERMGVEAGGQLHLDAGVTVSAALTISKNEYKEYRVDSAHYGNPGATADYSGNRVVGIPDVFTSVGLKYSPPGLRGAFVGVNLRSVGSYYVDDANTIEVPSSTVFGAEVGIERLTLGRGPLYVSVFAGVNNLSDLKYIGSAWLNPDIVAGRAVYIEPGLPRNFSGSLSLGLNL